jgi:hypothetical protein
MVPDGTAVDSYSGVLGCSPEPIYTHRVSEKRLELLRQSIDNSRTHIETLKARQDIGESDREDGIATERLHLEGLEALLAKEPSGSDLTAPAQAPPQYSPDGKWWWNGQAWVAVQQPAPPPPSTRPSVIVRNYKDQAEFAKDAPRMAAQGYDVVSQTVVPKKRGKWNWQPLEQNFGSILVTTYRRRGA